MDVHSFIDKVRENKKNDGFIYDVKRSIKVLEQRSISSPLDVPQAPNDARKKFLARCIHGHMFEDNVLAAALDDCRKTIQVKDDSVTTLKKQISERRSEFKDIYNANPSKKYSTVMAYAGEQAWKILTEICRRSNASKSVTVVKFEEWVRNTISTELMQSLRADFVARTGSSMLLVDLKFSTNKMKYYEDNQLIDGILQVLIYAILMGVDPNDVTLGVLVYYGREGEIVLYTTGKQHDYHCMKTLSQKAGIKSIAARKTQNDDYHKQVENTVKTTPLKGILKANANSLAKNRKTKTHLPDKEASEFSDDAEDIFSSDTKLIQGYMIDVVKVLALFVSVLIITIVLGYTM